MPPVGSKDVYNAEMTARYTIWVQYGLMRKKRLR